jgi:hypothetical protein
MRLYQAILKGHWSPRMPMLLAASPLNTLSRGTSTAFTQYLRIVKSSPCLPVSIDAQHRGEL